jgi:hypothetical protein
MVATFGDIRVPLGIQGGVVGVRQLAIACPLRAPGGDKCPLVIELLNPVIAPIGDIHIPIEVNEHEQRLVELTVFDAAFTPADKDIALPVGLENGLPVKISDIDIALAIYCDANRSTQGLRIFFVNPHPRGDEPTNPIKSLDPAIGTVRYEDIPLLIQCDATSGISPARIPEPHFAQPAPGGTPHSQEGS